LPGAVQRLPDNPAHPSRKLYKKEFARVTTKQLHIGDLAGKKRPRARTHASSIESGRRVQAREAKETDEAFKGVDVYSKLLPYHDKQRHTIYDLAHNGANTVKDVAFMVGNGHAVVEGKRFSAKKRKVENDLGRFPSLRPGADPPPGTRKRKTGAVPPWVVTKKRQDFMDALPKVCKLPKEFPRFRKWFRDCAFMKTAEALQLAGPLGAYVLQFADCDDGMRDLFIKLLLEVGQVRSK
jgi:hypothetical protein